MIRTRAAWLVLAALLAAFAFPAAAAAAADFDIGMGEQRAGIFTDAHWHELGLKDVRIVVGWDATTTKWQRDELDHWMAAAQGAGARVLVAFGDSRVPARNKMLPSAARYRREFLRFKKRYPYPRAYIPWNEANHCSQPTCHRPEMAAKYYNVIRAACPKCTVLAADVLDTPDMEEWLATFRKHARKGPKIWGLHNYLDANRFRTTGTRALLRAVKGEIWFTETGGLVKRRNKSPIKFPDSVVHAARATRWVFNRLATLSPRVKRIYLYHWSYPGDTATWDSAFFNAHGTPRLAYKVLRDEVRKRR